MNFLNIFGYIELGAAITAAVGAIVTQVHTKQALTVIGLQAIVQPILQSLAMIAPPVATLPPQLVTDILTAVVDVVNRSNPSHA